MPYGRKGSRLWLCIEEGEGRDSVSSRECQHLRERPVISGTRMKREKKEEKVSLVEFREKKTCVSQRRGGGFWYQGKRGDKEGPNLFKKIGGGAKGGIRGRLGDFLSP